MAGRPPLREPARHLRPSVLGMQGGWAAAGLRSPYLAVPAPCPLVSGGASRGHTGV